MAENAAREPQAKHTAPRDDTSRTDGRRRRKRRRPRRATPAPVDVAKRALEAAAAEQESPPLGRLAEEPLTPQEAATMRRHLKFLREHRRVLNLKVNAQEDLLLNERRPPTHRGVCQHLLAKVDRKRVFSAAERLEAESATRLVEGVLRICPDIDYALLYLDCVRRTGARAQAVAALSEALEHLDFEQVSQGQMHRVLDLIVELFNDQQRPQVLLGLFEGRAFRQAFDQNAAELPDSLAKLVVPLRAAQGVALHDKPNRYGAERLREGIRLLLRGSETALLRYGAPIRQRLLELGAQSYGRGDRVSARSLHALLDSFRDDEHIHRSLGIELARAHVTAAEEESAKKLLEELQRAHPSFPLPSRWLEILAAPRVGAVAVPEPHPDKPTQSHRRHKGGHRRRRAGVQLAGMRPVWVFAAPSSEPPAETLTTAVLAELCIPGVAPVVAEGMLDDHPFYAVTAPGVPLDSALDRKGGATRVGALRVCSDLVAILAAVARAEVALPDADLHRFDLDCNGRTWLVDLSGARQSADSGELLAQARAACRAIVNTARRFVPPNDLPAKLDEPSSFAALLRLVEPR